MTLTVSAESIATNPIYPNLPEPLRTLALGAHGALHPLWTKYTHGLGYEKAAWEKLANAISKLVHHASDTRDALRRSELRAVPQAFLVAYIEKATGTFLGADIFSEERPTLSLKFCQATIERGWGANYQEAYDDLVARINSPELSWVKPHVSRPLMAPRPREPGR